jgi:O-antigen/teichoic acid export membrane protein
MAGRDSSCMTSTTGEDAVADRSDRDAAADTRGQLRGSTLLLAGRLISTAVNFTVQVLIVRYLTETDYGAFAYALAFVNLAQTVVTFGLDRSITRFIPIYEEQGDYPRLFGTLVMVASTFVTLGLGVVILVIGLQDWLGATLIDDHAAVALIVILIFLAPIQALDDLLIGLFAVFANARAIFVRRHILGPGLRLLVVVLLVLTEQDVEFLAVGYVVSSALILALYGGLLLRFLRDRGLIERFDRSRVTVPARDVLAFTVPLLSSDLLYVLMSTTDVILLGYFYDATEVGALRAILPAATLNQAIFTAFTLLFTPAAARLFAREDRNGINNLYWRTAIWVAVFTFPVFLLTFSLAEPITVLLFGERYAGSAIYLAILSLGMYFNAALGFNGLTLKVVGRVRYVVILNAAAGVVNILLNVLLIPPYGALGAAVATGATLIAHNLLKQYGLKMAGIEIFEWRYLRVYVSIIVAALSVLAVEVWVRPGILGVVVVAGAASVAVFLANRRMLDVTDTFPELKRVPVLGRLMGG